jgi:hypothetical protein
MSAPRGQIEVIIDELVLHGFAPGYRDEVAAAVEKELAARLDGWRPASGSVVDHLDGGAFAVAPAATPGDVGREVAGHVARALGSNLRPARREGAR